MNLSPRADVVSARLRYLWDTRLRPLLHEAGCEMTDRPLTVVWRDSTLVLASPLDFGDGDPLGDLRGDLLQEVRTVERSIQAVVWEHWEAGRRRRVHDRVLLGGSDIGWVPAQESLAPRLRCVLDRHVEGTTRELFEDLAVVGSSRARLWLVSRDPDFRRRLASTPGAAYALHAAAAWSTGRARIEHPVVLDPDWPWPWAGLGRGTANR